MRRLVLPVKTSAVTVILLAGAMYVAAEAREAVVKRQELELARLEAGETSNNGIGNPGQPAVPSIPAPSSPSGPQAGAVPNVSATPKTTSTQTRQANEEHKRQIIISIADRRLA